MSVEEWGPAWCTVKAVRLRHAHTKARQLDSSVSYLLSCHKAFYMFRRLPTTHRASQPQQILQARYQDPTAEKET